MLLSFLRSSVFLPSNYAMTDFVPFINTLHTEQFHS